MGKTSQEWGSIGGNLTKKRHGLKHYKEIGRRGAEKRWRDYTGNDKIIKNGKEISWTSC